MATGLLGGTFDPPHLGHLNIALAGLRELSLSRVVFLPDGDPPHKRPLTTGAQRLAMAGLLARENPLLAVSDLEISRQGTTYTVDTLRGMRADAGQLFYLMGSDSFLAFPNWMMAEEIARMASVAVVMRPGDERAACERLMTGLSREMGLLGTILQTEGLSLSSGMVRAAAKKGESLLSLTTPAVARYIEENRLYR